MAAVEPANHALGRSRGGWTTKLHLACEQGRRPLSVLIAAGQRGDSPQFAAVIERIRVPRHGAGRPRTRPDRVLADKAYSSKHNRAYLRRRGIRCTIPVKDDQAWNRPVLPASRSNATSSVAGSHARLNKSSNRRPGSAAAQR